jgi:hypothetical protein
VTQTFAPQIVPLATAATLGPWSITVNRFVSGDEAWALLQEANAGNPAASALSGTDDGVAYALAEITVQNVGATRRVINGADFAAIGADGIIRRPPAIEIPEPALQAIVEPGENLTGYVPLLVDDPATATLIFDSTLLGGNWAQGVFALGDAAALPVFDPGDTASSDAGASIETAVEIGEPVRSGGWEVTIDEWVPGQIVWDEAAARDDLRARALGSGAIPYWRGIRVTARNLASYPQAFPNDAFLVCDGQGEPFDHILALTVPVPDISAEYMPGATRQGWAGFDWWVTWWERSNDEPAVVYVRFQANRLADPPRYILINPDGVGTSAPTDEEPEGTPEPLDVTVGDTVVVSGDPVNLRDEPSTDGEKIAELPVGTELTITGDPIEADGYTWYPVREPESGDEGFCVQDYLAVP